MDKIAIPYSHAAAAVVGTQDVLRHGGGYGDTMYVTPAQLEVLENAVIDGTLVKVKDKAPGGHGGGLGMFVTPEDAPCFTRMPA